MDSDVRRITSLTNPAVKEIRGLWMAKNRRETGLFIAEGLKLVIDALANDWPVQRLVMAVAGEATGPDERAEEVARRCRAAGGEVLLVSPAVLAKITRRDNPQAVVGVFPQRLADVRGVAPAPDDTWIVLEEVRDPGNLGTIVRTADAVGAAGIILVGDTVDPFSVEAVRATMGSVFHVPLARIRHEAFAELAARWPGPIVGTHLSATHDYRDPQAPGPQLLVMGPEQAGLSDAAAKLCNRLVKIPMAGQADSLNLAVATGVMLYELRRGVLKPQ